MNTVQAAHWLYTRRNCSKAEKYQCPHMLQAPSLYINDIVSSLLQNFRPKKCILFPGPLSNSEWSSLFSFFYCRCRIAFLGCSLLLLIVAIVSAFFSANVFLKYEDVKNSHICVFRERVTRRTLDASRRGTTVWATDLQY